MSFDRDGAVRDWRKSILSRGGLTVSEVDELEDHLELVEGDIREHLRPYEAFWLAAHRVGTPDALTREFAKVRPNMGWEVRAQWAMLGLLAYMLLVPAVQPLLYLLIVVLARSPELTGLAAGIRLNVMPLSLLLIFSSVAFTVRRSGASPTGVERAVSRFASFGWPGLALALVMLVAWQLGLNALMGNLYSAAKEALGSPGELAPIQSEVWYWLANGVAYGLPAFLLASIVRVQLRLERARPTQG